MVKPSKKRFPISLPLVTEIRLDLWSHVKDTTKTTLAENIIKDRTNNEDNWKGVIKDLMAEAAILNISPEELVKQVLRERGYADSIDIDNVDWSSLLGNQPKIEIIEE